MTNPVNLDNILPKREYISPFSRHIINTDELSKILKPEYNHGCCGGQNLGNTCFMNSSIACLSNCTELTTYFLTGNYQQDINATNKEGLGGKLANAWHELLEQYWLSDKKVGDPSNVKSAIARKVKKFWGFNQQDSNEFMTEFLSILSEDLNKSDKKNYKELKEKQEEETDQECAERFWKNHLERNDSIITDLFSGLLKSEVLCRKCGFQNITFDPFNTLTLAIPQNSKEFLLKNKKYEDIQFFYISKYNIKNNMRLKLRIRKNITIKDLKDQMYHLKNFPHQIGKLKFIQVLNGEFIRFIQDIDIVKSKEFIFAFDDEIKEGEEDKCKYIPLYMNKSEKDSAFPRLFFIKENMTFGEMKKKIYIFARNYFSCPFVSKEGEMSELDKEKHRYRAAKKEDNFETKKLFELYNKEYLDVFSLFSNDVPTTVDTGTGDSDGTNPQENNAEKNFLLEKFLNDFPYKIAIRRKNINLSDNIILFDGKNNLENLSKYDIYTDEDKIDKLIETIEEQKLHIFLILNPESKYEIKSIRLDSCENFEGPFFKKEEKLSLDHLLDYFCSNEYLDEGNQWLCTKCKNKVKVNKKFSIYFVPRLLIICLNRFERHGDNYQKNSESVDFPLEDLDMGKYICGPDKDHSKYDLFAISQHYGGTGGGHYTAVCKNIDGNWYDYNDASCYKSSTKGIVNNSAYVLFYRKRNW